MSASREPDIKPVRLSPVDIASLTSVEVRAVLVKLSGHPDPVVAEAVMEATQAVLTRTRCGLPGHAGLGLE